MKKKIALITAALLALSAADAFAKTEYDILSDTVTVEGETPSGQSGRFVSVKVTNPDEEGTLQFADNALSGENGTFKFTFKLHKDGKDDYGTYKTAVSGYDYGNAETAEFYVPDSSEISQIINDINTLLQSELAAKFADYAKKLNLNMDLFGSDICGEAVRIIKNDVSVKKFDDTDLEETLFRLKRDIVIAAYNSGKTEVFDSENNIMYTDLLKPEETDTDGITLYSLYENILSDEGKAALKNKMLKRNFDTCDAWKKEFAVQIMLNTIAYPNVGGIAYVEDVITAKDAAAVGLDASKYLASKNKSSVNSTVARKLYSSISELKNALDGSSGGTGGGGSSGGSSGGNSGGNSGGSSGGSSGSSGMISYTNPASDELKFRMFGDIPEDYWLFDELYAMKEKGIFEGDSDNKFNPDSPITREEFAKIICKALKIERTDADVSFSDVENNAWYTQYIYAAASNGIIKGYEDGSFGVGSNVTREDLCVMIYRAIGAENEDTPAPIFEFNDVSEISEYAKPAVDYMYMAKIVSGFDGHMFRPTDACTRAHAAKILYKIIEKISAENTEGE